MSREHEEDELHAHFADSMSLFARYWGGVVRKKYGPHAAAVVENAWSRAYRAEGLEAAYRAVKQRCDEYGALGQPPSLEQRLGAMERAVFGSSLA